MICRALLAVLLLSSGLALAATPEEQARELFREANQLFARKMFLDALQKYRQARALYPSYKIDLNIGSTLDAMGRRTEAALYFERFLTQSASAPQEIISAAKERLTQLRGKLGRVRVTSVLDGATVLADGVSVGTTPLDTPVYLEPGRHRLEARKQGERPGGRSVDVTAGQELSVDLSPDANASAPAIAGKSEVDPRVVEQRRRKTILGWSALGAGGACALVGVILYAVGGTKGSSAYDTYKSQTDPAAAERAWDDVQSAKNKVIAGHVMMGVAAVGLGISLYSFLTRPAAVEQPAGRVSLSPFAGGLQLGGTF
jgi:tetratricopeptide (TPR) repeat protein